MTTLYGPAQGVAAIKAEVLALHSAKTRQYHLRKGLLYLHWSALLLTKDRKQAWVVDIIKARACRRKFEVARECKPRPTDFNPIPASEDA